jgi:hypothetical protein
MSCKDNTLLTVKVICRTVGFAMNNMCRPIRDLSRKRFSVSAGFAAASKVLFREDIYKKEMIL